jgi:hypothetical protein
MKPKFFAFTQRKTTSVWSAVNVARVGEPPTARQAVVHKSDVA